MAAQEQAAWLPSLRFDDDTARRLEAISHHPEIVERRRRVREALAAQPGERVLDIGCGPGFLTAELAADVGPSGWVCGIDVSETMLEAARARCDAQPVASWVSVRPGDATALPFPDAVFDAAVASQVYEHVRNVPAALLELERVLRPGGRAAIVETDWDTLAWQTTDRVRTADVLAAWDEHLVDPHLPRALRPLLRRAGLSVEHVEVLNVLNLEWSGYSRSLAEAIVAFVVGRRGISRAATDAWIEDLHRVGEDDAAFFSLDQYLFLAVKPVPAG